MNTLITPKSFKEQPYQILGGPGSQQFLQIILLPGQQIITSEQCISYTSENVKIQEKYNFRERIKHYLGNEYPKFGCIVSNPTKNIQYIGLSLSSGRILVHDCSAYTLPDVTDTSFYQLGMLGSMLNLDFLHDLNLLSLNNIGIQDLIRSKENNSLNLKKQAQKIKDVIPYLI